MKKTSKRCIISFVLLFVFLLTNFSPVLASTDLLGSASQVEVTEPIETLETEPVGNEVIPAESETDESMEIESEVIEEVQESADADADKEDATQD